MKAKDLYLIIIRIFGLYLVVISISYYIPLISTLFYEMNEGSTAIALFVSLAIVLLIIFFILTQTHKIVSFFKLLKGHSNEDSWELGLNEETIIKIACIIISLYLFVSNLPVFIYHCFTFFESNRHEYSGILETFGVAIYFDFFIWAMSLCNLTIAYLLFSNYTFIATFLSRKIVEKDTEIIDNL